MRHNPPCLPDPPLPALLPTHPPKQITESTDEVIKIVGKGDSTKELFPLKMRDAAQAAGFAYIKAKGLIPEEDSDDYIPVSGQERVFLGGGVLACKLGSWVFFVVA